MSSPKKKRRRRRSRRRPLRTALVATGAVLLSVTVITTMLWAWFRPAPGTDSGVLAQAGLPAATQPLPVVAGGGAGATGSAAPPLNPSAGGEAAGRAAPGGAAGGIAPPGAAAPPPVAAVVPAPAPGSLPPGASPSLGPVPVDGAPAGAAPGGPSGAVKVGEAELGMRLYPGAQINVDDTTLVTDPTAGQAASTSLVSQDGFAKVAAFYRAQLAQVRTAQVDIQEEPHAAGQLTLRAIDRMTGANRTVLIVQSGAQVNVTLSRWQPPPASNGRVGG